MPANRVPLGNNDCDECGNCVCCYTYHEDDCPSIQEVNVMPTTPGAITYGVEIECYVPRNIGQRGVADALNNLPGINAIVTGYGGRDYSVWQVKTDASLRQAPSGYTGIEVVSPVLTWDDEAHAAQLRAVSEYLVGIDAKVNASCGGHVHMSVGHLTADGLANLIEGYYANHSAIDRTVARSRQGGGTWCRVNHYWQDAVSRIRSLGTREADYIGSHSNVINADWYRQRGTLEFRHREGSINHYKITGWVGFLVGLVRAAEHGSVGTFNTPADMAQHLVEGEYLSATLADWFLKRNLPTITSQIVEELRAARQAARVRVSRMFDLQGVR